MCDLYAAVTQVMAEMFIFLIPDRTFWRAFGFASFSVLLFFLKTELLWYKNQCFLYLVTYFWQNCENLRKPRNYKQLRICSFETIFFFFETTNKLFRWDYVEKQPFYKYEFGQRSPWDTEECGLFLSDIVEISFLDICHIIIHNLKWNNQPNQVISKCYFISFLIWPDRTRWFKAWLYDNNTPTDEVQQWVKRCVFFPVENDFLDCLRPVQVHLCLIWYDMREEESVITYTTACH